MIKNFAWSLFKNVLDTDCQETDIKAIFRLGKKGQAVRPLMVQLKEKAVKNRIMESLHKLGQAEEKFKNISIAHDLTVNERNECKALVSEAKKKQ